MNSEELISTLESVGDELTGSQLKDEVESILEAAEVSYSINNISGLEQPAHKQYLYEVNLGGDRYQLDVFTQDGRNSYPESHLQIEKAV